MNDLDHTTQGVTAAPTIEEGVKTLVGNIAKHLRVHHPSPDGVHNYANMLDEHAATLAGHVMANTPLIVGTHPAPVKPAAAVSQAPAAMPPSDEADEA